jgi:hypothetical protein
VFLYHSTLEKPATYPQAQAQLAELLAANKARGLETEARLSQAAQLRAAIEQSKEQAAAAESAASVLTRQLQGTGEQADELRAAEEQLAQLARAVAAEARVKADLMAELAKLRSQLQARSTTPAS